MAVKKPVFRHRWHPFAVVLICSAIHVCPVAHATEATADESSADYGALQEIVVTARKREESVMKTPVIVDVVSTQQIADLKIVDLADLSQTVSPDLKVSYGFSSVGTVVWIRGIGSGDSVAFADQSVGLNIDGAGLSQGVFYKAGSFDMAQIEVLKGPQGLFFGKSTTAGIIALHTADPTQQWETQVSAGDEFYANEHQINAFISGPLTEKLGIRLAGYYDSDDGWLYNPNPAASDHRLPNSEDFGGRLTLKWDDPDTGFRARFKVGAFNDYSHGNSATMNQGFGCPTGTRQTLTIARYDDCRLDQYTQGYGNSPPYDPNINWYTTLGNPVPFAIGTEDRYMGDGRPYGKTQTFNSVLQLDYDLMKGLTLTSVSAYSWAQTITTGASAYGLNTGFDLDGLFAETDYSEELRLTSNWSDRWINFMAGGLAAPSIATNTEFASIPSLTVWGTEYNLEHGRDFAAFGELILTPIDKWEIDPGVRFTHVYKYFPSLQVFNNFGIPGNVGVNQAPLLPENQRAINEDNTSPELTVSYHPTADWTIYGSYKKGYKGPGFNVQDFVTASYNPAITPNAVSPFGGERVEGEEAGIKGVLLDRHLNVSLTPYFYRYLGLQVSNFNYITHNLDTTNGADAKTYGFELSANYRPPVEGLQLNGYAAYNRAQFLSFPFSPCWGGQTAAEGCLTQGGAQIQNLAGKTPYEAPRWAGSLGADYEQPVGTFTVSYSVDGSFSSGYYTVADLLPDSWQSGWVTLDASVRLAAPNKAWDVALLGRNLTNRLYVLGASDAGTVTPGVMADAFGFTNRSRQVMLEVTVRPNRLF
jgi:iron complex outermembrane receptor protein